MSLSVVHPASASPPSARPPMTKRERKDTILGTGHPLLLHDEVVAPILLPARLVMIGAQRQFFTITDSGDAAAFDAQGFQIVFRRLGALGAECDIVFLRTALVAMTLDLNPGSRIGLQPARVLLQDRPVLWLDVVSVVAEVNVAERAIPAERSGVLELFQGTLGTEVAFTADRVALTLHALGLGGASGGQEEAQSGQSCQAGCTPASSHPTTTTTLVKCHYRFPPLETRSVCLSEPS